MPSHARLTRIAAAAVVTILVSVVLAAHAGAVEPASSGPVRSPLGFVGCVDLGFTPGVVTRDYCFVAVAIPAGADAGSISVRAWTYAHDLPGAVLTDERVVAPPTALVVGTDGSFVFSVDLPQMGSVLIRGAGAGVHAAAAQDEGNTSYPLTYALASPGASLTAYDAAAGPNVMQEGAVAGQRLVELQGAVWASDACGDWQFAGVL